MAWVYRGCSVAGLGFPWLGFMPFPRRVSADSYRLFPQSLSRFAEETEQDGGDNSAALRVSPLTFAKNNMKTVATILLSLALLGTSSFAEDPKAALMDFVLPVPDNFVTSAAGALKARNETVTYYLKVQGIQFPEGSRVELNDTKKIIVARLPHREALNLIQIINAFMGDSAAEWAKEFLEGSAIEGPENRCFGPLLK
jgi:hypothetical protein